MAEGFNDFQMEDLSIKYSEYDDMNREELNNEYDSLIKDGLNLIRDETDPQDEQFVYIKKRTNYIDHILENKFSETTFTDNNDGKTVTIKRKVDPSTSVLPPKVDITDKLLNKSGNDKLLAIQGFIRRNYSKNFRLDTYNVKAIEL